MFGAVEGVTGSSAPTCCTAILVLTMFGDVDGDTGVAVYCCAVMDADSMLGAVDTVIGDAVSC